MSSITPMIWPICSDDFSISLIAATACSTTVARGFGIFARRSSPRGRPRRRPCAAELTEAVSSSSAAAVSSSVAAWFSVRRDRSSEAWLISSAPELMLPAAAISRAMPSASRSRRGVEIVRGAGRIPPRRVSSTSVRLPSASADSPRRRSSTTCFCAAADAWRASASIAHPLHLGHVAGDLDHAVELAVRSRIGFIATSTQTSRPTCSAARPSGSRSGRSSAAAGRCGILVRPEKLFEGLADHLGPVAEHLRRSRR